MRSLLASVLPTAFGATLVTAGDFVNVLNTTGAPSWYLNDHTVILGPGGVWHIFGISHTEPADPIFEVNFAHAVSTVNSSVSRPSGFASLPFALGSILPETHLWAPHVVASDRGDYNMVYCAGGDDRMQYQLSLASSKDLFTWKREGVMFTAGIDGRDPMLLNLGPAFNNSWVIYFTGTDPNSLGNCSSVQHVTFARRALDSSLAKWSDPLIVFVGGSDGSCSGGPTESPFVVRRGTNFYLFSGAWNSYSDTRVFLSTDPFNFGSVPKATAVQVGEMPSHAPEVVRDRDGTWYVTRAGWGQGGLFVARLTWHDGLDSQPTSLPVPAYTPPLPPAFNTNLRGWAAVGGAWVASPSGVFGGDALENAFFMSRNQTNTPFTFEATVTLLTKDGNPTSSSGNWTRQGSAAALVFLCQRPEDPMSGAYVVNLMATGASTQGGLKIFAFPYRELFLAPMSIQQEIPYNLRVVVGRENQNTSITAYINDERVAQVTDSSFLSGTVGLNVWQSSANFQNVLLR